MARTLLRQLTTACEQRDLRRVHAILRRGVTLNQRCGAFPPLYVACTVPHNAQVIRALLAAGADPRYATKDGDTPTLYAAREGNTVTLRILLEACRALADEPGPNGEVPLCAAAVWQRRGAVRLLLAHGADPNRREAPHGWTALHYAAHGGSVACAEILLDHGADPCLGSHADDLPRNVARHWKRSRVLRLLASAV